MALIRGCFVFKEFAILNPAPKRTASDIGSGWSGYVLVRAPVTKTRPLTELFKQVQVGLRVAFLVMRQIRYTSAASDRYFPPVDFWFVGVIQHFACLNIRQV